MMKVVRKALGPFWRTQFLQGVIFEDFHQKHGFPGPLETILRQFTAQLRKSNDKISAKHSLPEKFSKKLWRSKISETMKFKRFHDEI